MDSVFLGKKIPWNFSLSDTGFPQSGHGFVNGDDLGTIRDVWNGELQKGTGCVADGWETEPPNGWTVNTDCYNVKKVRRANNLNTLSETDEGECEEG